MAGERTVRVKFDGDATGLARASDNAKRSVEDAAGGLDKFGEAADTMDTRAMGFRDTMTGVQDTMKGTALLAKGPSFEGFLTLGYGLGDLGSGIFNFVVPAFKAASLNMIKSAASTVTSTTATVAHTVASKAAAVGSKAWAAAQWLLNTAMLANPITWIVIAIVALIAIIVIIATKTDWFQRLWSAAWGWIKDAAAAVWNWLKANWPVLLAILTGPIGLAVLYIARHWDQIKAGAGAVKDWIVGKWDALVGFVTGLPGRMSKAASGLWDGLKESFRAAVNWLIAKWNNFHLTLGGGSIMGIDIPSITLNTPDIPYLAAGGTATRAGWALVGEHGPELLAMPRGASVVPLDRGAGGVVIENLTVRVRAYSDRFSLGQVMSDLAMRGVH